MGLGYIKKCCKCGYKIDCYEGTGMYFPLQYEETVQKAKNGELGDDLKIFFSEHEDGALNAERVLLCCEECGFLANKKELTMYIPQKIEYEEYEGKFKKIYEARMEYIKNAPEGRTLMKYYDEYAKFQHRCEKCDGKMRIVDRNEPLKCPVCKTLLEDGGWFVWD